MGLKKIAALLMAVCLMMSVCAPVFAGGPPPDLVIHDGVRRYEIYRSEPIAICEGRGWTYDTNMNTLILNGFDGNYVHIESYSSEDFGLILNGDNSVKLPEGLSKEELPYSFKGAVSNHTNLNISGTGSLTVNGGIYVFGNMTLHSGKVMATGHQFFPSDGGSYGLRSGVWVEGDFTVENGSLEATADSFLDAAIDCWQHRFTINGGRVCAKSLVDAGSFEMTDGELVIERGGLVCETFSLASGLAAIGGHSSTSKDELVHRNGELQYDYSKWNELEEGEEPFERASYVYISKARVPDQPTTPDTPITPPERPTPPDNAGSGSSSNSGSSYGGSSSGAAEKKEQKPKAYTAAQAQKDLKKAMKDGDGKVQLKNVAEIPFTALKVLKGENIVLQADQTEKGKIVFRMTLDPAKADAKVKAIQTGAKLEDKKAQEKFEKYFSNEMRFIQLNQKGSYGMEIKAAAKLDLKGMDTKNLYFYSYDAATNRYSRIQNPRYYVDRNGYLHFATTEGGTIIISEKPLARR